MSPPRSYMILYSFKKHISSWVVCLFWNHLLNVAIVILHLTPAASRDCPVILPGYRRGYYKEGDLIIGGVFQLFNYVAGIRRTHNIQPYQPKCFYPSFYFLRQFLAFEFAIKEINNNPKLLPNITLGYELYDSCYLEPSSVDKTLNILSGQHRYYPNYNCRKQGIVSGFVGHLLSSCSHSMANLLNIYKYPQISYGAMDPMFSDKARFPYFFRTIPSDHIQNAAIIQLLQEFGWTWVGILFSNDESSSRGSEELKKDIIKSGICIEFLLLLPAHEHEKNADRAYNILKNSSAKVIIIYSTFGYTLILLFQIYKFGLIEGKVWLLPVGFSVDKFNGIHYLQVFNGSFLFTSEEGNVSGLNEFINTVSPVTHPFEKYFLIEEMWRRMCIPYASSNSKKACIENSTLEELPEIKNNDKHLVSFIYSVYTAVYALAHALHDMYTAESHQESIHFFFKKLFHPRKLIWYLNHVHFKTPSGDEIFFDDKGDRPGKFDLYNWVLFQNGSTRSVKIGQYHSNSPNTSKIIFNESDIKWGPNITGTPHSVCSNSCLPGYRKMRREGQPICCYDCIPCKEGEITNRTDMEDCLQCSEDEWADDIKVECIKRTVYFLSIQDPVGASLTMATVGSCIITIIVMVIFIKHQDTPIVKASNWELSYILLVTLFLCFLCSFLIIGRPNYITCLLQQVTFSILFTTAVSSVLAKTITVLVAFTSTRPGRRMNIYTGRILSYSIILLCSLVEVVICTIWLVYSPPFPDRDAHSEMGKLILQCNVGSSIAFYSSLGFIGVLALFSFIVAFLTRKLPDRFNEAHYITFSMLVFGSVWISFIPVYLSTKGKYLVAVEIFAILASSAALLGFIFIPKCYIIMFRPHLNIKENICASKTN